MPDSATQASPDDADLEAWLARRDEAAFARLVQRHAALVTGICRRRLGAAQAEEAAQAVFIVLARRAERIAGASRLGGWLHGVAVRVCSEARRTATRRAHHERQSTMTDRPAMDGESSWEDLRPHLDDAIAELSAAQRDVVIGHFLEGLTQSAVAQRLGISEDAAHQRLHYAIAKLRAWFGKRGMAVGVAVLTVGLAGECRSAESLAVEGCVRAGLQPANAPAAAALAQPVLTAGTLPIVLAAAGLLLVAAGAGFVLLGGPTQVDGPAPLSSPAQSPGQLLHEDFEHDGRLAGAWYDNVDLVTTASAEAPDGCRAAEFRFAAGASAPVAGGTSRHLFRASESIRISYAVRYAPDWSLATRAAPLVQCMLLTDADERYATPSYTHLTCAIGIVGAVPFVSLQDARNIDVARIGQDLRAVTEQRAVAGGNAPPPPGADTNCFRREDGRRGNVSRFLVPDAALTDLPGPRSKSAWHRIEVQLRLNSIVQERAVADGRIAVLIDGRPALERSDLVLRTARHPRMRFNQLVLGPWMEEAPAAQTFWIDDLTVSTDALTSAR